jgi:hypothetical protein
MAKSKGEHRGEDQGTAGRSDDKSGSSEVSNRENEGSETFKLDGWQREVEEYQGNIALRAGRQVGKSTIIARKAAKYAIRNSKKSVMIISATERQAYLLFSKVLYFLHDNYRAYIKKGKDRPTKTEIKLSNGSIIRCLPTGIDGLGIRGYTIDLLIADEAAFIPEEVWPAITPMLATTGGKIILLSTPFGRRGYFYERFNDEDFKTWHINSEDVAEQRDEPQRTFMLDFQEKEKKRLTKLQYAQEYLGEFVDELRQLFSDEVIKYSCILRRERVQGFKGQELYLGIDVARLGRDEGTFEIIRKNSKDSMEHIESIVTKRKLTTETFDRVCELDRKWDFRRIGIDAGSGSLGVGILDFLLREPIIRKKIIPLNNLSRVLDHLGERKRQILKVDLYMNLLALMEKGILKLLDDDEVIASLRSVQYEHEVEKNKKSTIKIFGKDTHIAEGLTRAAWLANQKSLNPFISYI